MLGKLSFRLSGNDCVSLVSHSATVIGRLVSPRAYSTKTRFFSRTNNRPTQGFYSEKAEIKRDKLIVTYKNGHGKMKKINYGMI